MHQGRCGGLYCRLGGRLRFKRRPIPWSRFSRRGGRRAAFHQFAGVGIDVGEAGGFVPFEHPGGHLAHLFQCQQFLAQWQPAPDAKLLPLRTFKRTRFPINLRPPDIARSHWRQVRRSISVFQYQSGPAYDKRTLALLSAWTMASKLASFIDWAAPDWQSSEN